MYAASAINMIRYYSNKASALYLLVEIFGIFHGNLESSTVPVVLVHCLPYTLAVSAVHTFEAAWMLSEVWDLTPPTDAAWKMNGRSKRACMEMKRWEYERLTKCSGHELPGRLLMKCMGFEVDC